MSKPAWGRSAFARAVEGGLTTWGGRRSRVPSARPSIRSTHLRRAANALDRLK